MPIRTQPFDALRARFGGKSEVGVSAIGPAGEQQARIASVMNDRYHAFGRQGFGAIYGSKNLKAIVVAGSGEVPIANPTRFRELCNQVTAEYKSALSWQMRFMVYMTKPKTWLAWMYRLMTRFGLKVEAPQQAMRQLWSDRGTTGAVAISIENGDAPIKNWKGVGSIDFPMSTKGSKIDGAQVDKYITKKLSCGDCPMPCKGIVAVKSRGLSDVRRPDYETIAGFGANILNDDLEIITACHDACNRYGMDAVSSSATRSRSVCWRPRLPRSKPSASGWPGRLRSTSGSRPTAGRSKRLARSSPATGATGKCRSKSKPVSRRTGCGCGWMSARRSACVPRRR
jgi:aldehyde:ferredoxin oxidoreductase